MLLWVCGSCMWILKEFTCQIVWHFLACRPEMISFGWLKTCMLLDRVVDILWYGGFPKWWYPTTLGFPSVLGVPPFKETPISILTVQFFQVLRTHFLKLTFSGKSSRLKVTFERLKKNTEVWRDFIVIPTWTKNGLVAKPHTKKNTYRYSMTFYGNFNPQTILVRRFCQKKLTASDPVKLHQLEQQLGWRGHRKVNTSACWWETISGVACKKSRKVPEISWIFACLFGFEFILIMLFFYENSTWNWTHLYILLAALIGYTCYTGDHDVVICSWGHGICYQEGLRSQDRR